MKIKSFLLATEIITCIFWLMFFSVVFFVNPQKSDPGIFILFFISLFFAIAGTWGVIELAIATRRQGLEALPKKVFSSFRHGVMLSLILTCMLAMQGIGVLTLWDAVIFILAILLFEAYFMTRGNIVETKKG